MKLKSHISSVSSFSVTFLFNSYYQVSLVIDLDHVADFNSDLAEAIQDNARRYTNLFADVIYELLPQYKEHEVSKYLLINILGLGVIHYQVSEMKE